MHDDALAAAVRETLAAELAVDAAAVRDDASLADDLGVDSLQAVALMTAVEDRLDVRLPDDLLDGLRTVGDFVAAVVRVARQAEAQAHAQAPTR